MLTDFLPTLGDDSARVLTDVIANSVPSGPHFFRGLGADVTLGLLESCAFVLGLFAGPKNWDTLPIKPLKLAKYVSILKRSRYPIRELLTRSCDWVVPRRLL